MARKDEKTIKLSADTADVQKAFQRVEAAYADVAEAANDYAAAVAASSQAVTKEEKAIAKENEATTKTILANAKKRAGALKTQSIAMREQQKALQDLTTGTNTQTKATKQAEVASESTTTKMNGARVATLALAAAAIGLATKFADFVRIAAEAEGATERTKREAERMTAALEGVKTQAAQTVVEIANLTASLVGMDGAGSALERIEHNVEQIRAGFALVNIMVRDGTNALDAYGTMVKEIERAEFLVKMNKKYQDGLIETAEMEAEIAAQMEQNDAERLKSMEEGDRKRKKAADDAAAAARKRRAEDIALAKSAETDLAFESAEADRINAEEEIAKAKAEGIRLIDETNVRLAQELELRQALQMNRAIAAGEDIEALTRQQELERSLFEIRGSGVGDEEKARAEQIAGIQFQTGALEKLKQKRKEDADVAKASSKMAQDAALGAGVAAFEAAGVANAGVALEAGKKAAFYTGESIASFAAFNPVSGALFAAAAVQQGIVAGGALIGGASGGGGKGGAKSPASVAPQSRSSQPMSATQSGPRESSMTVNVNTLSYVSPEDARRIAVSESREAQAIVGGRK